MPSVYQKHLKTRMEIINFSEQNSIINQYLAEIRDKDYQKNRLLFRNNVMRIGEFEAFEISKTLNYESRSVVTPLGTAQVNVPTDKIVLATIFRAGLPFHNGFLNIFDHAGNAFVSAYREYKDAAHHEVGIHVEYLATPDINGKTLIIADPMLAPEGSAHIRKTFPDSKTTIWCAAIDEKLNEHQYIVPGFGDAGDLCYGEKI